MASPKPPSTTAGGPAQGFLDFSEPRRAEPSTRMPPATATAGVAKFTPKVYSVAELVRAAARTLEARFSEIWVEGEISNLSKPRSGHLYFTLKDQEGQLPSVMFKTQALKLGFD